MHSEQDKNLGNTISSGDYIKQVYASCYKQVKVEKKENLCGDT